MNLSDKNGEGRKGRRERGLLTNQIKGGWHSMPVCRGLLGIFCEKHRPRYKCVTVPKPYTALLSNLVWP